MKKTTEQLIKADLLRLYKHVMQWYDEHPEGKGHSKDSLACYGSAVFGITYDEFSDKELSVANMTLNGKHGTYVEIEASINHREKSSKSEEKIVP